MLTHTVKRLPVVDADNRLLGIISRVDILRALAQPAVAESPRQNPPPGRPATVGQIMLTNIRPVPANASLAQVVNLLVSNVRRRVVVVDDRQQVVGIITDGDLIKRATPAERPGIVQLLTRRLPLGQTHSIALGDRTAAQVMTTPVITVSPHTLLPDALQLLLTHHVKRLPVVNAQGQVVGLVGRAGILQVLARNLED
jgi:CBS-domain-containing membrane protein